MSEPELTEADALIMAAECPLVIAAYRTGDDEVIRRMEATHPASRCHYVKQAHAANSPATSPPNASDPRPPPKPNSANASTATWNASSKAR